MDAGWVGGCVVFVCVWARMCTHACKSPNDKCCKNAKSSNRITDVIHSVNTDKTECAGRIENTFSKKKDFDSLFLTKIKKKRNPFNYQKQTENHPV
jgi:hypothetical protein